MVMTTKKPAVVMAPRARFGDVFVVVDVVWPQWPSAVPAQTLEVCEGRLVTVEEHSTNSWLVLTAMTACVILASFSLVCPALVWMVVVAVAAVPVRRILTDPSDHDSHY